MERPAAQGERHAGSHRRRSEKDGERLSADPAASPLGVRDQMPKIIRSDRKEVEADRLFKKHMQVVEGELAAP